MTDPKAFEPDGRHLPKIKPHSLEKLGLHNYYAEIFSAGMAQLWPNRVYLGLYSGAGAAEVDGTDGVVMTSALSVLTQPVPFTHYIFVDEDADCIDALRFRADRLGMSDRVALINENVNASVDEILAVLPDWRSEGGVLTFCFIDPFKVDLDFEVIRRLSHLKVDILLMVPLGYDVRRNWRDYVERPAMRDRLSAFLGDSGWVQAWQDARRPYSEFPRFIQDRVNAAMANLGFIEMQYRDIRDVKVAGKNVYLYSLHLYSKNPKAIDFWRAALKGTDPQFKLDL